MPTAVSAVKIDGVRAYRRVRAGEEVTIEPRQVTVHELSISAIRVAGECVDVDISVRCSSGTYVRAIARDVGATLLVGGHLSALRRTSVGPYSLDQARTLDQLAEDFVLLPIADAARAAFPVLEADEATADAVRVGRPLELALPELTAIFAPDGAFLALYQSRGDVARPTAVFV